LGLSKARKQISLFATNPGGRKGYTNKKKEKMVTISLALPPKNVKMCSLGWGRAKKFSPPGPAEKRRLRLAA
jgi:hypothetical protein